MANKTGGQLQYNENENTKSHDPKSYGQTHAVGKRGGDPKSYGQTHVSKTK